VTYTIYVPPTNSDGNLGVLEFQDLLCTPATPLATTKFWCLGWNIHTWVPNLCGSTIPTTNTHYEQHIHVSNPTSYNTWEVFLSGFEKHSFNKHVLHHLEGVMKGVDL